MVAALFISRTGPYWGREDVDAWDEGRDARLYDGDLPVVAHPPCGRWCRLAKLVESRLGYRVGDDGGCFESALASVRRCGGVLEHPAWSLAWSRYGLLRPTGAGWQRSLERPEEWVCEVWQSAYGHRADKSTWLLYVGAAPPEPMRWARPRGDAVISGCQNRCRTRNRVWSAEASRTPPEFAEALIGLARGARA